MYLCGVALVMGSSASAGGRVAYVWDGNAFRPKRYMTPGKFADYKRFYTLQTIHGADTESAPTCVSSPYTV